MLILYLLLIIFSRMLINFGDAKDGIICRSRAYTCFACLERPGGMSMAVASRRCSNEFNNSTLAFDDEIFDSKALYGASGFDDGKSNEPKFCHSKDLLWTGFLYVNNSWWFRDVSNERTIESSSSYNAKYALRKYLWNSTTKHNELIRIDKMAAEKYAKENTEEILCGAISLTKKLLLPMRCDESTKVTGALCSSDISRCVYGYGENNGQNCTVRQRGRKSKPLRVYCKRKVDVGGIGAVNADVYFSHGRPCNYSKNALRLRCLDDATRCHHKTDTSLPRITILSLSLMAVAVLCVSFLAANLFCGSLKNLLLISTAHRCIDRREYGRMIDMSNLIQNS